MAFQSFIDCLGESEWLQQTLTALLFVGALIGCQGGGGGRGRPHSATVADKCGDMGDTLARGTSRRCSHRAGVAVGAVSAAVRRGRRAVQRRRADVHIRAGAERVSRIAGVPVPAVHHRGHSGGSDGECGVRQRRPGAAGGSGAGRRRHADAGQLALAAALVAAAGVVDVLSDHRRLPSAAVRARVADVFVGARRADWAKRVEQALGIAPSAADATTTAAEEGSVADSPTTSMPVSPDARAPVHPVSDVAPWRTALDEAALRQRLWIGFTLQLFQQLSGINAVLFYSVQIFESLNHHHLGASRASARSQGALRASLSVGVRHVYALRAGDELRGMVDMAIRAGDAGRPVKAAGVSGVRFGAVGARLGRGRQLGVRVQKHAGQRNRHSDGVAQIQRPAEEHKVKQQQRGGLGVSQHVVGERRGAPDGQKDGHVHEQRHDTRQEDHGQRRRRRLKVLDGRRTRASIIVQQRQRRQDAQRRQRRGVQLQLQRVAFHLSLQRARPDLIVRRDQHTAVGVGETDPVEFEVVGSVHHHTQQQQRHREPQPPRQRLVVRQPLDGHHADGVQVLEELIEGHRVVLQRQSHRRKAAGDRRQRQPGAGHHKVHKRQRGRVRWQRTPPPPPPVRAAETVAGKSGRVRRLRPWQRWQAHRTGAGVGCHVSGRATDSFLRGALRHPLPIRLAG
eukprot:ctg_29.g7